MAENNISKMIREVRTAIGLTQEQFAAKIGMTVTTVNRWENDKGKLYPLAMRQLEKLQQKIIRTK